MSIAVRTPHAHEWPACRMLLPREFRGSIAPEAVVAWDEERGAMAGAAVFHRLPRETAGVQVVVIKPYRRQGVGSLLLSRVVERARERGDERVSTWTDVVANPGSDVFLEANGFVAGTWMLRQEGDLELIRETVRTWRKRLVSQGKAPASARIVPRHEMDSETLRVWYEQTIAPQLHGRPEYAGYIFGAPELDALVLLVDDRPGGMLAGTRNDGRGVATLSAVAVAPEFQGGWGWANLFLLAAAFDRAWAAGSRRIRYDVEQSNWKVLSSGGRMHAVTLGRSARFVRGL